LQRRTNNIEARVPDPSAAFGFSLIDVLEEAETIQYLIHPYEPRHYYIATREINIAGLVYVDADNQMLGEDYSRDALNALRAGNVFDTMSSDWVKISSFKETITPRRNKKVKIRTEEIDWLVNLGGGLQGQFTINDEAERDGEIGVNLFVYEQQKIYLYLPGVTETEIGVDEVNMGELPLDTALALGDRILLNRNNLPNRVQFGIIGIDLTLQKGHPFNALGRSSADLGNFIVEARRMEGSRDGSFMTVKGRQSEE
jgi:hypothetical protein